MSKYKEFGKVVLYKEFGRYCVTAEDNYNSYIRDYASVCKFPYESDKQEVIDTIYRYGMCNPGELIDRTGE